MFVYPVQSRAVYIHHIYKRHLHEILGVTPLGSVGLIHDFSNSLNIRWGELNLPNILLEVLQNPHQPRFSESGDLILILDVLEVRWYHRDEVLPLSQTHARETWPAVTWCFCRPPSGDGQPTTKS